MDKKNIESIFPLTTTQKGLLFHFLKEGEEGAYIGQHMLYLKNKIDIKLFEESLQLLAKRYEIFRTRIVYSKLENPVQVVLKESPTEFYYSEEEKWKDFLENDRARGFSFEKENLIRIALLRTGEDNYINVWTFHHILIDGYCIDLLAKDFFEIYRSLQDGTEFELSPVPSYQNYVNWLKGQDIEKSRAYWLDYTRGVEKTVSVPGDLDGSKGESGKLSVTLSGAVSEKLADYAAGQQVTLNALMQTLWGTVLSAYTGAEDFIIGDVMAARPLDMPDADRIVGLFSGTYPVRFCGGKNRTFGEIAQQLNRDFLLAIQNACCSLGEIPSVSQKIRNIYVFENFDLTALYEGAKRAGLEVTDVKMKNHSNYEFSISVSQRGKEIVLDFRYDTAKYSENAIRTIGKDMETVADLVCKGELHHPNRAKEIVKYHHIETDKTETAVREKQAEHVQPKTELEKKLAGIVTVVLGVEEPGIYDDFFEMGGDSISGMRFVANCEKNGLKIGLKELFRYSNIAQMAELLETNTGEKDSCAVGKYKPDLEHRYEPFPLNGIQTAYVMGVNEEFELGGFTTQYYAEVEGDYDILRLEQAMQKVIEHQAALRTIIEDVTSQRILKEIDGFRILFEDLVQYSGEEQENILLDWREKMTTSVFAPEDFPYFKIKAFRLEEHTYRLCFLIECVCVDGAGLMMLLQELCHYYETPEEPLPEITFTFRDYQMALLEEAKKEVYQKDKAYWMQKADFLPLAPELSQKANPEQLKNPHFLRKQHLFEKEQYEEIKQYCRDNKVTVAALLCTAYMEILSFWSGSTDFSINMTVFERNAYHEDVERLIGDFTKLIIVDTQMEKRDLLSQTRVTTETIAEALEHSSYNCMNLIREIAFRRHQGTKSVMPYVFTCALMDSSNPVMKPVFSLSRTPQVYIDCQVTERDGGLFVNWDYPEGLFEEEMLTEMFEQYVQLIARVKQNPEITASEQTRKFVVAYNDTFDTTEERIVIAQTSLPDLFVPSFSKYADNAAVQDSEKEWDYRTLAEYTYKTVAALKKNQVTSGSFVGVVGERKAETVAGILAVLLCGAAYVPLNTEYPPERVQYIMEKTNAKLKIDADFVNRAMEEEVTDTSFVQEAKPDELAYIIFTSGTTGRPKGVAIRHNSAVNTILDINRRCEITQKDRFIGLAEFGFDLSVYDLFGSLSSGAKLCIVQNQRNPEEILELLEREKITFWNSVPAVMQMVTGVVEKEYRNTCLRNVYLSGDWIPLNLPDKIRLHFTGAKVTSLGGATEASIWSIYYPTESEFQISSVPYGMPLKNQTIYIMNRNMELCPVGVRGEICIGGDGVAEGYYREEEKTAAAFVEHPQYGRIYKTGDYGKWHPEGYVEFLGRIDGQIKIRGFRVELGEIESCALEYGEISQAVAVKKPFQQGEMLVLYIETVNEIDTEALKQFLKEKLPDYMIPSAIVRMEHFPVTQNGKIDRSRLKASELNIKKNARYEPRTEEEYRIAQIFMKLLETDRIDYEQSFFEMGIDSLKAVIIINDLKKNGIHISLTDIYEHNTVAALTEMLNREEENEEVSDDFEDGEI